MESKVEKLPRYRIVRSRKRSSDGADRWGVEWNLLNHLLLLKYSTSLICVSFFLFFVFAYF
ncbi:hypothetical protein PAPH110629_07465 [Paenibacillus phoenicis]